MLGGRKDGEGGGVSEVHEIGFPSCTSNESDCHCPCLSMIAENYDTFTNKLIVFSNLEP